MLFRSILRWGFLTRGAEERQLLPCSIVVQDHARDADLARIQLRRQSIDILHESHMFSRYDQGISCSCRDPQHIGILVRRGRINQGDIIIAHAHVDQRLKASRGQFRSEEHTSELQSLMRISYAVFCLKKKKTKNSDHKS